MRIKLLILLAMISGNAVSQQLFPYDSLKGNSDRSALMVEGIAKFLINKTIEAKKQRPTRWNYDFSSADHFYRSTVVNRKLLADRLGVRDKPSAPDLQLISDEYLRPLVIERKEFFIYAVRWKVLEDLWAEGLLMQPKGKLTARIVMLPDADMAPEVLAGIGKSDVPGWGSAQSLVRSGAQIVIPVLVSREADYSGVPSLNLFTNQPHREWIYRQAYEMGRHVIGYELQKIFSVLDWFDQQNKNQKSQTSFGVIGFGEGGMLALYSAALDRRIKSTIVSGYFNEREQLWAEPIYRNVFGLLNTFGDAELAVLAWPNKVVVEHSPGPIVDGPPVASGNRRVAAPGRIGSIQRSSAYEEWKRASDIVPATNTNVYWTETQQGGPFGHNALSLFARHLNMTRLYFPPPIRQNHNGAWIDFKRRQERTVNDMVRNVQRTLQLSSRTRDTFFWQNLKGDTLADVHRKEELRKSLGEVLGSVNDSLEKLSPKARKIDESGKWVSYEVELNVFSDVFAWGILMVPKNMAPGEKRAVVVCQHGLEGQPSDMVTVDSTAENYHFYKGLATRLCERGYITFSPHNPYRGGDKFRVLQRRANPIGLTLFSIITAQHEQILRWLSSLSFVDSTRIGFYGLSYGGKTAMRVPSQLHGYVLSICSGDFNEWVVKNTTTDSDLSYLFTDQYEMPEWDLGHTFNYAEMAALIAPRPFMVERGTEDKVAIDEWVDYEFARIRRYYFQLGIPERCKIEHFKGPHTINGVGTFEFLDKYLSGNRNGK